MSNKQPVASVLNTWGHISIWCLNHESPVEMEVLTNQEKIKTPFYACKKGISEKNCANRMNLDDYQGIVLKFLDMVAEDPFSDFTNRSFNYKGTRQKLFVKVIKYTTDDIRLGIRNLTVLGQGGKNGRNK